MIFLQSGIQSGHHGLSDVWDILKYDFIKRGVSGKEINKAEDSLISKLVVTQVKRGDSLIMKCF